MKPSEGMKIEVVCPVCKTKHGIPHKELITSKARIVRECAVCKGKYSVNNLNLASRCGVDVRLEVSK